MSRRGRSHGRRQTGRKKPCGGGWRASPCTPPAHEHGAGGLCPPQLAAIRAMRTQSLSTDGEAGAEEVMGAEPESGGGCGEYATNCETLPDSKRLGGRRRIETVRNTKEAGENKRRRKARQRGVAR